jgi:hypothetical protein
MAPRASRTKRSSKAGKAASKKHVLRTDPTDAHLIEKDGTDRLVICQLKVPLPKGVFTHDISVRHPNDIFDVANWVEWNKGTNLVVFRVYTSDKWDCAKELEESPDVISVRNSTTEGSAQEFHIIHKSPRFLTFFKRFGVMQKTPIRINNGISTWEVVGTAQSIQRMTQALRKLSIAVTPDPLYRNAESIGNSVQRPEKPVGGVLGTPKSEDSGHYIVCKLRCTLPRPFWHYEMSKRHPDTAVEVLGYSILEGEMLVDLRVQTNDLPAWADELSSFADIHNVKILGRPGTGSTLRVTYKAFDIQATIQSLHLIVRTPFSVKNGIAELVMAGPEESIRRFIATYPDLQAQVDAVYSSERGGSAVLTTRQSEVFHRAMAAGYFEVPRRVTLTELAERIGVAVSSLSEMLAVVEKKLLQEVQTSGTQ